MYSTQGPIIGKYKVEYPCTAKDITNFMYTDNPLEAVWEANKKNGEVINICGEKEFYQDESGWHIKKNI